MHVCKIICTQQIHSSTKPQSTYFFRCLSRRALTNFRLDLSTPPVPNEKLPPLGNSGLPGAVNGDGLCGVEVF